MNHKQRIALALAVVTGFVAPFMSSALNLSVTAISADFLCPSGAATWIVNIYTLAIAAFSLPMGHLADLRGRRIMVIGGSALFCLAAIISVFAFNVWMLIAMRLVMGFGSAMMLSSNVPLMLTYFEPSKKGRYVGISVIGVTAGVASGPVLGGIITSFLGWRFIFIVAVAATLAAVALAFMLDNDKPAEKPPRADWGGAGLFGVGIVLLMFGLSELNAQRWAIACVVFGAVLLAVFVKREFNVEHPLVQVRLFVGNLGYSCANLACMLSFASTFAINYTMALYLQNVLGFNAATAGLFVIGQPIMQAIISPISGRAVERFSAQKLSAIGIVVQTLALISFTFISTHGPAWMVAASFVLIGIGTGLFSPPNTAFVLTCGGTEHYAEANSTISAMRGLGQSVSMAIAAFMLSAGLGGAVFTQADPTVLCDTIRHIVIVCTVLSAISIPIALVGREKR